MTTIYFNLEKLFDGRKNKHSAILILIFTCLLSTPFFANAQAVNKQDSTALVTLYDSTGGPAWLKTWNLKTPVSKWNGITLANGRVVSLNLSGNNLHGKIPSAIGKLSSLVGLNLGKNRLKGPIPKALGALVNLTVLNLYSDSLTGSIPAFTDSLAKLTTLVLSNNALTDQIPAGIWRLKNLSDLELNGNNLSDTIPAAIGNLTNLTKLDLSSNLLSGQIPAALVKLANLTYLNLKINFLTGNIPYSIGNLSKLTFIDLLGNLLTGAIPTSFWKLDSLQYLRFDNNQLTGSISPAVSNLKKLQNFSVSANNFTDTMPVAAFLQLSKLSYIDLTLNKFTFTSFESAKALTKLFGTAYYAQQQPIPLHYAAAKLFANGGGTLSKKAFRWIISDSKGTTLKDTTIYRDTVFVPQLSGSYKVYVTDSLVPDLKILSNSVAVVLPSQVKIAANPGTEICANTLVTVTASVINQKGKVSYQWKKDGKTVGTNSATYTDSTFKTADSLVCLLTDSGRTVGSNVLKFTVNAAVKPSVTISYTPATAVGTGICPGTLVQFSASAQNAGSVPVYQWYKDGLAVGKNATVYTDSLLKNGDSVTVKLTSNAGCAVNKAVVGKYVKITVLPGKPVTPVITGPATVKAGDKGVVFKVPFVSGVSYAWSVSAGDSIKAGQGTDSISVKWGTAAGTVTIKEANTCGSTTATKTIAIKTGGADPKYLPGNPNIKVLVYPNPATDAANLQISGFSGKVFVTIADINGKVVLQQQNVSVGTTTLPLSRLSPGLFIVTVRDNNNLRSIKLVKAQ